jgi:uncharacterized protein (DUF1697 family)
MRQIALLRGINLGSTRRVPMAALRELLGDAGYEEVQTYVQSGNIVFKSGEDPRRLERSLGKLISDEFGFEVPVIVRTRDQLARVVKRNPLRDVADNNKRYQVSFLTGKLDRKTADTLLALVVEPEALVINGTEVYAWHTEGVARSKVWNTLASKGLGVGATARNWTTVETLLTMADE